MDSDASRIPELTVHPTEQPHVARAAEIVTQPVRKPDLEAVIPLEAQEVYKNSPFLKKLNEQQATKPFG
ncbi:MAG: hypothetical protein NUV52_03550, partial [Candidatus Roizmanbacteria bacterium]|nr:hypothetical protein [Candidatus Roizmanbacteria bacterium]